MLTISNRGIVLEAIRRSTWTSDKPDGSTIQGCRPSSVFHRLKGWMDVEEKRIVFNQLLKEGVIVVGFNRYKRALQPGRRESMETVYGQLSSFHPRAPQKSPLVKFVTTPKGRFLPHHLGKITPPENIDHYYEFIWSSMFIVANGLPSDFPTENVAVWK